MCCCPCAGGRNAFSQRVQACYATINVTSPNDLQLKRIFGTLLNHKLSDFDESVRPLGDPLVAATIEIYRSVSRELLPTPSKSHYLFNTRDLAKVIQGLMQVRRGPRGRAGNTGDNVTPIDCPIAARPLLGLTPANSQGRNC